MARSTYLRFAVLALVALSFAGCEGCDKRQPPVTRVDRAAPVLSVVAAPEVPSRCSLWAPR